MWAACLEVDYTALTDILCLESNTALTDILCLESNTALTDMLWL